MFANVLRWLPIALVAVTALWLRTHDLAVRPMHADEANQAVKVGALLERGHYEFDPADHHGPTLYYAALPIAWLRGERNLAALSETTVRLVPALSGTLSVLLLYFFAAAFGRWAAINAAAFLAIAPASVYYSRYFIQESLLLAFFLATIVCTQCWWRSGNWRWALGAGVGAGLMQATKASAPLFIFAALIALWVVRMNTLQTTRPKRDLAVFLGAFFLSAALFYSSFGTHFGGLSDALSTYAPAAGRVTEGSGHEKPWFYFLSLFGWQRSGGLLWQQFLFSGLVLGGALVALRHSHPFLRGALIYTIVVGIALAVTPYKTPWHVIHLIPGLAVLAAGALAAIQLRSVAIVLASFVIFSQWRQTNLAVFLRPADARNPYAYVHSSPDVRKVRGLAESALANSPQGAIRVISEEYWPLPWYFRGLDRVGYWSLPPDDCDAAMILASAANAAAVRSRLRGRYRESFLGLRPGFICTVFIEETP